MLDDEVAQERLSAALVFLIGTIVCSMLARQEGVRAGRVSRGDEEAAWP